MATMAPPRGANPFDGSGVRAESGGVRRYPGLHASLLEMLRDSALAAPDAEALAGVGGRRISYAQLWDAAARVAGGLRDAGIRPGDRVAIRLPNSVDWVLAFFVPGAQSGLPGIAVGQNLLVVPTGNIITAFG
jgi:non-ribosomal peptide synthetase component F